MIIEGIGPREEYANLQITITRPARLHKSFAFLFDILRWRYFEPKTFKLDQTQLLTHTPDSAAYGNFLGKSVFADKNLGTYYKETLAAVQGRGNGLRVRLVIEPPELHEIHWERIYHPIAGEWLPLGSTAATPFSRFIRPQQWDRPSPLTERPLRILVVISSPANLESGFQLDHITTQERQRLHAVMAQIPELDPVYLESGTAKPPTLNEIRKHLADGFHLIHFLCHGVHTAQGTGLFLEDDHGEVDPIDQDRLVKVFKALKTPPVFCFLAACETAKRSRLDGMLPLGPALVEDGGLQAVVAMTGRVGLEVAQLFSAQFYVRLFKHGVVDLAVNEARALIQDDWDWGVPVLFTRLEDNQLIDFPIGKIYERYLSHTDSAFVAIDEAIDAARLEQHGQDLIDDLQELVDELGKSHAALVGVADKFRRTGRDPQDFSKKFEQFYYDFKAYFDGQTWINESTSCQRIDLLRKKVLPKLAVLLNPENFTKLQDELDLLSNADGDLLRYFNEYLNTMNSAVEQIWNLLDVDKIEEAIQTKRDFEAHISPSFQRSKQMFERMSHSIRGVQSA